MQDNDHDPQGDAAKIVFMVFAIAFAAYIILLRHSVVNAQDAGVQILETGDLDDLEGTEGTEDPFFGIEGVEPQQFGDLEEEEVQEENLSIEESEQHLPEPPNPYMKKNFKKEDWFRHHDYEYFLWLEYKPMNDAEKELLEKEKEQVQAEIRDAVLQHLFLCVRRQDHMGVLNKTCKSAHGGCERLIDALTTYIVAVAYDLHLDPWEFAAIAMHESTFNPFAVGKIGEKGYFQLNPHSGIGKKVKFVKSKRYRKKCKKKIGNCQLEVAKAAAIHLYKDYKRCGGDMAKALTAYNTGSCTFKNGKTRKVYVDKIIKLKKTLRAGCRPLKWCDGKSKEKILVPYNQDKSCLHYNLH
jgi:hypothetical protein